MNDRYTFPLSDAGFALALQVGASKARHGRVTMVCEPIGMGHPALVLTVTPCTRLTSRVVEHFRYGNMTALHLECGHVVYVKRTKRKPDAVNCTVCRTPATVPA